MFDKDSIKYKLIVVTSSMILVLMCVLLAFQLYSSLTLESEVQESSINRLQEYSEEENRNLLERLRSDIAFYIDMMALTISTELYNLNDESLNDKSRKFIQHDAICSIVIIDAISNAPITEIRKEGARGCVATSVGIMHAGERIGRLDVEYTLARFEEIANETRLQLEVARERLHEDMTAVSHRNILIQIVIYVIATLILLNLIVTRINRSIIRPIYALMLDMRRVNQNEQALLQLGDGCHGEDELGRLCRYFYEHIATLIHQLNKRANYDDLTSLLSRQRLIGDIQRRDKFNLAILDIDRFKEINNLLGIEAGDELLKATSVSLVAFFTRDGYALYRLNADEFAVLDGAGEEQAAFEKRIREFVEDYGRKELTVKNEPISVAISSGLSDSREPMPMMAATTALKYAKEKKAKVAIYRRDLPILKEYECNLRVAKVIRHAIEEDLVVPFFQPIKDVGNGSVYKYEALMRIRDRSGVIHAPLEFLEISKKSGSYGDLSHRLIKKSVALFRDRKEILAINLSILDIEDDGFLGFLRKLRDTYGIMDRLIFEITEQERV